MLRRFYFVPAPSEKPLPISAKAPTPQGFAHHRDPESLCRPAACVRHLGGSCGAGEYCAPCRPEPQCAGRRARTERAEASHRLRSFSRAAQSNQTQARCFPHHKACDSVRNLPRGRSAHDLPACRCEKDSAPERAAVHPSKDPLRAIARSDHRCPVAAPRARLQNPPGASDT